jgi:hypothetical protein
MKYVSTEKQLKNLLKQLGENLECGAAAEIALGNESLIVNAPKYAMSSNLSLIDAYEKEGTLIIVVVNRFGTKCK